MATTNGNRKILDMKRWEFCSPAPAGTQAGTLVVSSRHYRQQQLYLASLTAHYLYNPNEDGWVQLPSAALAGSLGAGMCGTATSFGPTGTATAGTTTTMTTNLTLARDLRGYSVNFTAGPNAGTTVKIARNTVGANAVITFETTLGTAVTTSSVYRLVTPRWYIMGSGTLAVNAAKYYDYALNTWTAITITGLPATWGTDGRLVATPSWMDDAYVSFGNGTASAGAASTLTDGAKNWTVNQWANSQVRIVSGTGAGQIRTIASNTATVITTSAAWTITPDATSVYSIEGNDDYLYLMGNNAVTMYRYSISANTWTTLAPTAARAAAPGPALSGHWVWDTSEPTWADQNAIMNGRRIYSFRGNANSGLDYYDIALNTWVSAVVYAPAVETITTGSKYAYRGDYLYIEKESTGRWFRYNFVTQEMDPWGTMTYPQGTAVIGDTCFDITYHDGATEIGYIYFLLNTSTVLLRQMVI